MTDSLSDSGPLRRVFVNPPEEALGRLDCPDADTILRTVHGETGHAEMIVLLDHVAACPACTIAWRLSFEGMRQETESFGAPASEDPGSDAVRVVPSRADRRVWRTWLAAAAVVAGLSIIGLGIGSGILGRRPWNATTPVYRTFSTPEIESLIDDDTPLPRSECALRWSPGPEGSRYNVVVTDTELTPIAQVFALESENYTVPEQSLAPVPPGGKIFWQVVAVLPDGSRVGSATFVSLIE